MSILSDKERQGLNRRLKRFLRQSKRIELIAEFEAVVGEACARLMDDLSHADPLQGPVWGICKRGARRIRESSKPEADHEGRTNH